MRNLQYMKETDSDKGFVKTGVGGVLWDMETGSVKQDRKLYIDLLRIVACFSVIMLHCASQYWYEFPVTDPKWLIYNSWDAVSRFGVPIFVMISGMLFLSREGQPDVKRLYTNNILRLAVAYFVWCIAYGLWDCSAWFGAEGVTLRDYAAEMVLGRYHLWFVPMLIGIYMLLPVLKTFTDHCSKKTLEYFLLLFLILQIGRSTLAIIRIPTLVNVWVSLLDVEMVCSYVGYFVAGYYLYRYRLSGKTCRLLYFAGAVSMALAAVVSGVTAYIYQEPRAEAFDSYSVFTMLVSVAVFVFFQEKVSKWQWKNTGRRIIRELSANTFGVYLIHLLVLEWLQSKGIDSLTILSGLFGETAAGCLVGIPVLAVVGYATANLIIMLLRRLPVAGKYIC